MTSKHFKSIVIDASIACSCGERGPEIQEKRGRALRDFLMKMLHETEHHAVMTREIGDEWNAHSHRFARIWRVWMEGKRRIDHLDVIPDQRLKEKIEIIDCSDRDLQFMLKDLRLIDAAIEADNTIASLDEKVRALYAKASTDIVELKDIIWINPTNDDEGSILWLLNGANPEDVRLLRNFPATRS
jgi:hypothetical protein